MITFIRVIQGLLIVLSSQAIVVAAVMIGIIIYINIMQRSKEIGVMKAVGYQNRDVKGIFIYDIIWIGKLPYCWHFGCTRWEVWRMRL